VTNWITQTTNSSKYNAQGLNSSSDYEFEVEANCSSGSSGFSNNETFTTLPLGGSGTTYTVSGNISNASSGINVSFDGQTVQTNSSGNYSFSNINAGTSGSIVPSSPNYNFSPSSINISNINANSTGNDFTASSVPLAYLDVGNIRIYADNIPTSGSVRQVFGNIRLSLQNAVNTAINIDGTLTVSLVPSDLYIEGNSKIYMSNIPYVNGDLKLYEGSFKLGVTGDDLLKEILNEVNQELKMAGLSTPITNIKLIPNGIEIEGNIKLPDVVETFLGNKVKASTDKIQITTTNGIQLNGEVGVYDLQILGTIKLNHLILTFLTIEKQFECATEIQVKNFFEIGAKVVLKSGKLDEVTVNYVPVTPKPIGTTGLAFKELQGSVSNIQEGPVTLQGVADLVPTLQHSLDILVLNDLTLTFYWGTKFTGSGNVTLFQKQLAQASLEITKNSLSLGGNINLYDFLDFNLGGTISKVNNRIKLRGDFGGIVQVPSTSKLDELPRWFRVPAKAIINATSSLNPGDVFGASQNVLYNDTPVNSNGGLFGYFKTDFQANLAFTTYSIPKIYYKLIWNNGSLNPSFGTNYNFLPTNIKQDLNALPQNALIVSQSNMPILMGNSNTLEFDLSLATSSLLVEVESNVLPDIQIELPNGTIVNKQNINSFLNITYFEDVDYGVFHFNNPQLGKYNIQKNAIDSITVRSANNPPDINISNVTQSTSNKTLIATWNANDHDDDALISIGLARNVSGSHYIEFSDSIPESSNSYLINHSNLATGIYHVKATIRDGVGEFATAYSKNSYKLIEQNAPIAPNGLTAIATDTSISLSWTKTQNSQKNFIIYYDSDTGLVSYNASSFGVGDKTSFNITTLPAGKYYEFVVTALDTFSRESDYSNIATVNYISTTLNNAPVLEKPKTIILEVGDNWSLQLTATDIDNDILSYQLLESPTNLTISNQGIISWIPTIDQMYHHTVSVKVDDNNGDSDIKTFKILVLNDESALAQVHFNKSIFTNHSDKGLINILDRNKENASFEAFDTVQVRVYSTSDMNGISLVATEKNALSNEYSTLLRFSNSQSSGNQLFTQNGDSIWVEYYDVGEGKLVQNIARFILLESNFDIPNEICTESQLKLTNRSIGSGLKYNWNINGITYVEKTPEHTFMATNFGNSQEVQNIQLTITDIEGRIHTKNTTILVSQRPALDIQDTLAACDEVIINTQNSNNQVVWTNRDTINTKIFHESAYETIEVTNAKGCISRDTVQVKILNTMQLATTIQEILCHGQTANISLDISLGTAPFLFNWSNDSTSQNLIGIPADTYELTVIDSNNCERRDTFMITEPSPVLTLVNQTANLCYGEAQATASVAATGGVGDFSYNWTGINNSSPIANNLSAGSYSVDVADANGCTVTEAITISEPTDITLNAVIVPVDCHGASTGKILGNLLGGIAPYNFSWSDGSQDLVRNNLSEGIYNAFIIDGNGCADSLTVQVSEPNPLILSSIVDTLSCFENSQGSLNLSVTGGVSAYNYHWNTGANSQDISNLDAGIYSVTVTDDNLCQQYLTDTITQPLVINTVISKVAVDCYGNSTGSTNIMATGGTGTLDFSWNDGTTGNNRTNLTSGFYFVTISDANACTRVDTIEILEPDALSLSYSIQEPSCNGFSDGAITAFAFGGTNSYEYNWDNNDTTSLIQSLSFGNYTLTLTDENGCIYTEIIQVGQPDSLSVTGQISHPICYESVNGEILQSVTGGTMPYNYNWENGIQSENRINLTDGNYTATVVDANGCIDSTTYTLQISNPLDVSLLTQDEICTSASGSAISNPIGGVAPFIYTWNTGDTIANINNLSFGNYSVTITDSLGCTSSLSKIIYSVNPMDATPQVNDITCFGYNDGSINVVPNNGTAPFNYIWNDGVALQNRTSLSSGQYNVTVTDINGCIFSIDTTIAEPGALIMNFGNIVSPCLTPNSGELSVFVGGGINPISYQWDNTNQTTATISNLEEGAYNVTATDANGCQVFNSAPIEIYGMPIANFGLIMNGNEVSFLDSSMNSQILSWNFGDGNSSYIDNPTHIYTNNGNYTVSMIVENPCGTDTMTTEIGIFPTGINQLMNNCELKIYPNPSNGLFTLELDCILGNKLYDIEIYNAIGQRIKLYQGLNQQNNQQLVDLTEAPNGIYFIHLLNNKNQQTHPIKVIIQK
jgi:PKD repeat protein